MSGGIEFPLNVADLLHERGRAAKFPCVVTAAQRHAYARQLECFQRASEGFSIARISSCEVVAFDMPGTGESTLELSKDADLVYRAVIAACGGAHRRTGIFGISFGGHWAAKLALKGDVDFAVNLGGPIAAASTDAALLVNLPNGMTGIVANAMRLPSLPTAAVVTSILEAFSLSAQGLLTPHALSAMSPMLVINGDDDPYVPPSAG